MIAKATTFALALLVAAGAAHAENWRRSSGTDEANAYIDTETIRRSGDRVTFAPEIRWPGPRQLSDGKAYDRIAAIYEGDCAAMTVRLVRFQVKLRTSIVVAGDGTGEIEPAAPGSTVEGDLRAACRGQWPD